MRDYFKSVQLATGEWVDVIYSSSHKVGTSFHSVDLIKALNRAQVKTIFFGYSYLMSKKNKDEQMFGSNRVIDLRF